MFRGAFFQLFAFLAFVFWPCLTGLAGIRPSFRLSLSSWCATHIVVVNDRGVVQEVLKGDLNPGDTLPIADFNLPSSADVYYRHFERDTPPEGVAKVTGHRLYLFLIRNLEDDVTNQWTPAELRKEHFDVSTVWIESAQCFAIQQWVNPGPALMRPLHISDRELRAKILSDREIQTRLRKANGIEDPARRAKALITFLDPTRGEALREALRDITKCGQPAWPALRPLLSDDEYLPIHRHIIHISAMVAAKAAVPEMERIVQEESEYWRSLPREDSKTYTSPNSDHYSRLSAALGGLITAGYVDHKGIVASLIREWDLSPSLRHLGSNDRRRRSPILELADRIASP